MPWPWLICEIPSMPDDWAIAFDDAMTEIARLHLPPQFRVTRVYETLGTLRIEWHHAGAAENDVARIALKLAIRTDSWSIDPNDISF